jgi:hypothetical protein
MALPNNLSSLGSIANAMFNSMSANSTAVTSMTVGGTTINASGVSGNSNIFVGNSTVNAVVSSNGLVVGNSTVNAVVNSTAFTVANSTVTYSYTAPTATQQSNTSFFLNANGSWAAVSTMPVVSSLNALQLGII